MNSLNDLLNKKADDLYDQSTINPLSNTDIEDKENEEKTSVVENNIDSKKPETTEIENNNQNTLDITKLKTVAYKIKDQLDSLIRILEGQEIKRDQLINEDIEILNTGERIVEGVFNGEKMVGSDGKEYSIPPNYASKSKLVEGDLMKLTITKNGSFIYKQIQPTPRKRISGELVFNSDTSTWNVLVGGRTYKVITASITFFKGKAGDEVILLVPQDGESDWGAVENIINK